MVAQHLAVRHPDRVRSALVACTGPSADPATMGERAAAARAHGMAGVLGTTLERWFTPAALAADPPHPGVAYGRRTLLALDPEAFAQGWETIATHDATPRLGEVRATVTCVAGAQDVSAPPSRVRAVADAVPGARFVVVDGPHVLPLEEPATFASVLREHLRAAAVG
jgi:pimeloyl-ACP methyl ester carboxylesterase